MGTGEDDCEPKDLCWLSLWKHGICGVIITSLWHGCKTDVG